MFRMAASCAREQAGASTTPLASSMQNYSVPI